MKCGNKIFWIFVVIVAATAIFDRGNCAKLYILEENSVNKVVPSRLRRQTHPAATIAKLPTQDTGVFTPIVGPTQSTDHLFRQNLDFSSSDTLVDYLLPPNPNAQFTSLNFQDPSANLQSIDSFFDVAPTSSSSDTINTFQPLQNQFTSSPGSFSNQISITAPNPGADSVHGLSFQNSPLSSLPSLSLSSPPQPANANQFIQNKESSPLSRELNSVNTNTFKNYNHFKPSSNFVKSDPIGNSNFVKIEPAVNSNFIKNNDPVNSNQANQGKWDLGYDANDILAPPNPETSRTTEYDTINGNKYKKPNVPPPSNTLGPPNTILPVNDLSPPGNTFLPPSNTLSPPSTQFNSVNNQFIQPNQFSQPNQFQSNNQFFQTQFQPQQSNFNQFNPSQTSSNNQFIPSNGQFSQQNPAPASNNHISVPSLSPTNEQSDVVWGTQKQIGGTFIPTTSAPFLPTIPPSNGNQNSINFQQTGFGNGQNLQQFPSTQLSSDQIYQQFTGNTNSQNFALDTPLTSQFDSFLPQGTVSDHSFFPVNENVRHFQRKRQVDEEEEHEEEVDDPAYESSQSQFKTGPGVYSFVKTDKNGHFKWSVRHQSRR